MVVHVPMLSQDIYLLAGAGRRTCDVCPRSAIQKTLSSWRSVGRRRRPHLRTRARQTPKGQQGEMMNLHGRLLRLEKRTSDNNTDEMTDSQLLLGLRTMFRADPLRRWEEELPAMGWGRSNILEEERAAIDAGIGT